MRVLGIDPGTANVGVGLVEKNGLGYKLIHHQCITTSPKENGNDRLSFIFQALSVMITDHKPEMVVMESLFFAVNARSAMAVGKAMGAISIATSMHHVPLVEYTPLQIKKYLCGYGRAQKIDIQNRVKELLHLDKIPRPQHAADALAVALTFFENNSQNTART